MEIDRRPQTRAQWVRLIGNAVNLTTPLGLAVAAVGRARIRRGPRGLLLCDGYRLPFPVAGAFTIGSVITTRHDWATLERRWPRLLEHEERHTWQYLLCLGLPFFPAYAVAMAWSVLRTGDRAAGNLFERDAGLELGGYPDAPVRPVRENLAGLVGRLRR